MIGYKNLRLLWSPFTREKAFISAAALFSLYWVYLIFASQMSISADAVGYEDLGRMLQTKGFLAYFVTGPNREPIFPFLISLAMRMGEAWNLSYQLIEKFFHLAIMLLSSWFMLVLLRRLKVSPISIFCIILYFGLSPAMINSGLSLFSEIASYPFVLLSVNLAVKAWIGAISGKGFAVVDALFLAMAILGLIFVKAYFEAAHLFFILPFFIAAGIYAWRKDWSRALHFLCIFFITLGIVSLFCHVYRSLNKTFNGQYVVTSRGPWALYGNSALRSEPLTSGRTIAAVAYIPGEGVCQKVSSEEDCLAVSFHAQDSLGLGHVHELERNGMTPENVNKILIGDVLRKAIQHPGQHVFFSVCEGLKFFFWESTQIGFVTYPGWLERIYQKNAVRYGVRFVMALLTVLAVSWGAYVLVRPHYDVYGQCVIAWSLFFIFCTSFFYSFFSVLTRYVFPVVPLYLILIGVLIEGVVGNCVGSHGREPVS